MRKVAKEAARERATEYAKDRAKMTPQEKLAQAKAQLKGSLAQEKGWQAKREIARLEKQVAAGRDKKAGQTDESPEKA